MNSVVDRFMRYARIHTTSDDATEHTTPSTDQQFELAHLLRDELEEMGVSVTLDEHAYVIGTLRGTPDARHVPALALIAHIDTTPDAPGLDVDPKIITYRGGVHVLDEKTGTSLDPALTPELDGLVGEELIVTDGTTLLGADDKAGVAEIMQLAERLTDPEFEGSHPALKFVFVPDEEIGHGAALLDLTRLGAEWGYTVDGGNIGELEHECFNAASAIVTVAGHMIHPGSAKGVMVNALTLLNRFDSLLPADERPEYTEGYEGFFHLMDITGTVDRAVGTYIVRDHDAETFASRLDLMRKTAAQVNQEAGSERVTVDIKETYRNMTEMVEPHMHLIENAKTAFEEHGIRPVVSPIRGGTDGAQLSFRGLPCPNLSAGGLNFHSTSEFIPVASLETMVDVLETLVSLYAHEQVEEDED